MRSQHLLVSTKYFSLGTVAVENKTVREENVVGRPREELDKESNQGQIACQWKYDSTARSISTP